MRIVIALVIFGLVGFSSCKSTNKKMQGPKGKYIVQSVKTDSIADKEMTIIFNEETGQINGRGVCNSYSSTYVVSGESIKFSPAISTKMMCPEGTSLEYNFFQALLKANTFSIKKGKLSLYNAENKLILTAKDD